MPSADNLAYNEIPVRKRKPRVRQKPVEPFARAKHPRLIEADLTDAQIEDALNWSPLQIRNRLIRQLIEYRNTPRAARHLFNAEIRDIGDLLNL